MLDIFWALSEFPRIVALISSENSTTRISPHSGLCGVIRPYRLNLHQSQYCYLHLPTRTVEDGFGSPPGQGILAQNGKQNRLAPFGGSGLLQCLPVCKWTMGVEAVVDQPDWAPYSAHHFTKETILPRSKASFFY